MAKVLDQEMQYYFTQLNEAEKQSVVEMLKTFVSSRYNDDKKLTLEDYDAALEKADAEIEEGDFMPHDEVMKRYFKK